MIYDRDIQSGKRCLLPADIGMDLREIFQVMRLCDPDFLTDKALTFHVPPVDLQEAWMAWMDRVFFPKIGERMLRTHSLAWRDCSYEIRKIDRQLSESLTAPLRFASESAGSLLLTDFIPPAGTRVLPRMLRGYLEGDVPANYAIIFAIRCAIFHISKSQMLCAYLYKEWQCGASDLVKETDLPEVSGVFQRLKLSAFKDVNPLLRENEPDLSAPVL